MLTAAKEETFSAPMVWTNECVLPLAASGVYPKTRVWGSEPENLHCFSATSPLKIELRWGCEECSEKTAVGSGVTFKYDPFGRRIYKSSTSGTSVYAYDGDNLIEETNATGGVVARYEQTQNIDEPLAMLRTSATSYFHADGLGSITSLSNSAGTIANTYTYDSYGDLTASTGTLVNSFRYTGRESDPETGLYYYRARYYDPSTGRFLREDPAGFGGGINFYSYVSNTPPNGNDPFGLWSPAAHRQLIWNALHGCNGISDADIWQIQQGSQWFDDNFQDPIWSFGHAMSNGNAHQSPDDAKRATSAFISGQVGIAKNDLGAGTSPLTTRKGRRLHLSLVRSE